MPTLAREITHFSLSSGAEEALIGWWWFTTGDHPLADLVTDVSASLATDYWWDNSGTTEARPYYATQTAIAGRWLELIDQDTNQVIQTAPLPLPTNAAGLSASGQLPAEVAMCVSVRSGFSDKHGNGRFYLPPPCFDTMSLVGTFNSAPISDIVSALGEYFDAVHGETTGMTLGTWSQSEKAFTPATSINIGHIPDSQRRRRNKLVEIRDSYVLA